jgi:type III pantothenate kinase
MEINLVVLNLGNSRLASAVFEAGELGEVTRTPHTEIDQWQQIIGNAWKRIANRENATVVAASVNPKLREQLENAVSAVANRDIVWVGEDLDLPIRVLTDNPKETGVDRVLTMAAAYEQLGKACVVVDAGTAVTVNCCNDNGDFLGGAIAPGVEMALAAMHKGTALLPKIDFDVPKGAYGTSTSSAILHGVYHSIRGLVKEVVENYATELGTWPELIATGGDAERLFNGWELVHAISPDLGMYGIALAYAEHHIHNDSEA